MSRHVLYSTVAYTFLVSQYDFKGNFSSPVLSERPVKSIGTHDVDVEFPHSTKDIA